MFNKFALVITGLMLTVSSVGCCCLGGYGYGAGYRMNGCAPCNNGCAPMGGGGYQVAPTGYTTQGAQVFQGDMSQTAFAPGGYTQSAYVTPSQSAFMTPSQSAYSTALAPIQGPPIYNTAVTNSLPTY